MDTEQIELQEIESSNMKREEAAWNEAEEIQAACHWAETEFAEIRKMKTRKGNLYGPTEKSYRQIRKYEDSRYLDREREK